MSTVRLVVGVDVGAPAGPTWDLLTDWDDQSTWMLLTTVRAVGGPAQGVGGRVEARTGLGPLGVLDTMVLTAWDPPRSADVDHLGRVVSGTGTFAVEPRGDEACRVVWTEDLSLPLGRAGRLGWVLARPVAAAGLRLSLERFALRAELLAGTGARPPA